MTGRIESNSPLAFAVAGLLVGVAAAIRWGIGTLGEGISPMTTFYPAVLFSALLGGWGPGLLASTAGGVLAWWAFMMPEHAFLPLRSGDAMTLVLYGLASSVLIWGADHYRALTKRLEDEERLRKIAVGELAHRLKNKVATILSIVRYQLRDYPALREEIAGRLMALSATDDLIMATQGQGAYVHDIVGAELNPYARERAFVAGPLVLLPPKLALTVAMLLHELATNAAKHGALAGAAGHLSVAWSVSENKFNLEWRETGGPAVSPPAYKGFGMRLLATALEQFGGRSDVRFEPGGLACEMDFPLTGASDAASEASIGVTHPVIGASVVPPNTLH